MAARATALASNLVFLIASPHCVIPAAEGLSPDPDGGFAVVGVTGSDGCGFAGFPAVKEPERSLMKGCGPRAGGPGETESTLIRRGPAGSVAVVSLPLA